MATSEGWVQSIVCSCERGKGWRGVSGLTTGPGGGAVRAVSC